jgi:DNA-binding transcriptional MerR regulator
MNEDGSHIAFADGKEPDALRTIGEVATALGIRQHVLRYWEEQFPMLRPIKRSGGRRYYRPEDIRLLSNIVQLVHREGYTLKGARKALENVGDKAESVLQQTSSATMPVETGTNVTVRLRAIRAELAMALAAA